MKTLIGISGSLRQDSFNTRLLKYARVLLAEQGVDLQIADLNELVLPFFNQEIQDAGFPANLDKLKTLLEKADGLVIAQPEYNHSIPAVLKNAIDWLSRYRPSPLKNKHAFLMSASPGSVGGNRGLWALRRPLEVCGVHVFTSMYSLSSAKTAFGDNGLVDPARRARLEGDLQAFIEFADARTS